MKRIVLLSVLLLAITVGAKAQNTEVSKVVVNMSCDTMVAPDKITLQVTIQSDKGAGKKGLDIAQERLYGILQKAGIDTKKEVSVIDFSSYYDKNDVVLRRTLKITAKTMEQVDLLLQAGQTNGIANINITKLENTHRESITAEIRKKALLAARAQAQEMAGVYGQKAGSAIFISEYNSSSQERVMPVMYAKAANDSMGAADLDTPIQNITIRVNVTVWFALEK